MPWAELSDTVASVPALHGVGISAEVRPDQQSGLVPRLWLATPKAGAFFESGFWVWLTLGSTHFSVRFCLLAAVANRAVFQAVEVLPGSDPRPHDRGTPWLVAPPAEVSAEIRAQLVADVGPPTSCPDCGARLEDMTVIGDTRVQLACSSKVCRSGGKVFGWAPQEVA